MWIVRLALRRPYTFTVVGLLIILAGLVAMLRMPKDIFPAVDVPVIAVVWTYNGLSADEMEKRIVTSSERTLGQQVNDIEHIESQCVAGVGVIKIFLQPEGSADAAMAQATATTSRSLRDAPQGASPPLIIRYRASNVPIMQIGVGSKTLPEQTLYDLALNSLRIPLAAVRGSSIPNPAGGKVRQVIVDIDPVALRAQGLTPNDVTNALAAQNLTLPAGTTKIGETEYNVALNSSPDAVAELAQMPIKTVNGTMLYVRDVALVRDGNAVQTNIVRQNGTRGTLLSVMKTGNASTIKVIEDIKAILPRVMSTLPPELELHLLFDQSRFVRAALDGVLHEGILAGGLTALMLLLFLGSWRNTLVVALSIPLSIFCSILALAALGQTINMMTLGGLALAVGILVDDATVEIENIDRNLAQHKPLIDAILDGARQIAMPAFVSTLCICIVFLPIFFLEGTARYLFSPLALAVIFAMLASYLLSRTVVPTMVHFLLQHHPVLHDDGSERALNVGDAAWRVHVRFNRKFERFRAGYGRVLAWALDHRLAMALIASGLFALSALLVPRLGRDYFPLVDAAQFRFHVRARAGTRIEETERITGQVEAMMREVIPPGDLLAILDLIGLQNSPTNLANGDGATIGPADAEIMVSLNPKKHLSTAEYVRRIRARATHDFPDCTFFSQDSDIVSQVLNFGLPSPIDVQFAGRDRNGNYKLAQEFAARVRKIPGAVDVHVHQVLNAPTLKINVDRSRAAELGMTQRDVANNVLTSLSGTTQSAPNYWLNPANGVQYLVSTQTAPYRLNSVSALQDTPVSGSSVTGGSQMLGNISTIERVVTPSVINHYDVQPVIDVYANVDGRDLGSVATPVRRLVREFTPRMSRGNFISVRGQAETMDASFISLGLGLVAAMILVYCLLVINFQSWLDPLIIVTALPGGLCGIVWMLLATRTTLSVPALMGSIMCMGVATANAILVVTFANDQRKIGRDARQAAYEAGFTRLRPVLMTALAMIIGMLPTALGQGEGGEQNAPLGRAVIGGLLVATFATLLLVPVVYATFRRKAAHRPEEVIAEELEEAHAPHA